MNQKNTKKNLAKVITAFATFTGIAVIGLLVLYLIQNDSGHTGFDPYLALFAFVPITIVGLAHLAFLRFGGLAGWFATLAIIVGISGMGLLVYLDRSNTLLQYEAWIERGMPERGSR